jgi:hypothetical protein
MKSQRTYFEIMFIPYISIQRYYRAENCDVAVTTERCVSDSVPIPVSHSLPRPATAFCRTRLHTYLENDTVGMKSDIPIKVKKKTMGI